METGHLLDQRVDRILVGVDRAVENHRAYPFGEPLQISRTQFGAVAVTEVVDLLLTEGLTDRVHVSGGRGGADAGKEGSAHSVQT